MASIISVLFGDPNAKVVKQLRKDADKINALEPSVQALSSEELRAKTIEFRDRLAKGETLDALSHEAFAVVREASRRVLGQRHFDVQLMGGLALHRGTIAEMRTGEGKTLTATLPTYLNALTGKGVHVVTVNDYLAKRDAVWMGKIFASLGLTVGCIQHESGYVYDAEYKIEAPVDGAETTASFHVAQDSLRPVSRKDAYGVDITYGTNNEFGFDYLRDNMASSIEQVVQRGLYYAIVDEVDSILIDEARTPLIISAPAEESADLYYKFAEVITHCTEGADFNIDEKMRVSTFTEAGLQKLEKLLGVQNLYEEGIAMVHHAEQALKAHALFKNDRDYVVQNGEVKIVDEFTGRIMEGRRYSEGLHQAIEAKEGVKIQRESKTLATITFQNYFRMYEKLAGMTGTASTEAEEFSKIYKLDVITIPTNHPAMRTDFPDKIYKNENGKWLALVEEVKRLHEKGQPVLIGTVSIEKNERLSEYLKLAGIPHNMLNAKNHEHEGEVIAQAGRKGAVTLATNMAGRGVDILLGGNPVDAQMAEEVKSLGGLHVIGTERHESRRIDNQLRGRAGRQGDSGSTQFFVSLDDDLMRIFGSERVKGMMDSLGIDDSTPIESKMVTKALEKAQQRVEGHHFDTRKHVLEYDDVLNKHRTAIYSERREFMGSLEKAHELVASTVEKEVERVVYFHTSKADSDVPDGFVEGAEKHDWDPKEVVESLSTMVKLEGEEKQSILDSLKELSKDKEKLAHQRSGVIEIVTCAMRRAYDNTVAKFGDADRIMAIERGVLLRATDAMWMQHLDDMTYLRRTIGLQGYAQRDPLVEYKREAFRLYGAMRQEIGREVSYNLYKIFDQAVATRAMFQAAPSLIRQAAAFLSAQGTDATTMVNVPSNGVIESRTLPLNKGESEGVAHSEKKPRPNEPCYCGSGKKFKKCHGK
ncbi:MAG: preprotein translocase subunit SecA [Patescibacteria group bacterium]|jgi:preprotein translocase subunit SecA